MAAGLPKQSSPEIGLVFDVAWPIMHHLKDLPLLEHGRGRFTYTRFSVVDSATVTQVLMRHRSRQRRRRGDRYLQVMCCDGHSRSFSKRAEAPDEARPMTHIVLLGDSVFDNAAYVAAGQAVIDRLKGRLESAWRATLEARDGAIITDMLRQIERVPPDATHLVISIGGNDALGSSLVLDEAARSVGEAVARLADVQSEFRRDYARMLDAVLCREIPTAICTIYDGRFSDADLRRISNTALAVLNDVITREAAACGLPLLDLRVLFDQEADFANEIEPSAQGGKKLARAIVQVVAEHDFTRRRSSVYASAMGSDRLA